MYNENELFQFFMDSQLCTRNEIYSIHLLFKAKRNLLLYGLRFSLFLVRQKILYYHYEQRQKYVRYRSVEDEHSPPMVHHESPTVCVRCQRDTEFPIRSLDWYLRRNIIKDFILRAICIFFSTTITKTNSLNSLKSQPTLTAKYLFLESLNFSLLFNNRHILTIRTIESDA